MTVYNIEVKIDDKWNYLAQAYNKYKAIEIAERFKNSKLRIRKVVKTVVWTSKNDI